MAKVYKLSGNHAKPTSWSRYKQWEMQRPNGSMLNITDDGVQISAGRDNIGRHNLNCIARGPGGITKKLVQVDVLNDYWTNIIFRKNSSTEPFSVLVTFLSVLSPSIEIRKKFRIFKKFTDKYLLLYFGSDYCFNNSCS